MGDVGSRVDGEDMGVSDVDRNDLRLASQVGANRTRVLTSGFRSSGMGRRVDGEVGFDLASRGGGGGGVLDVLLGFDCWSRVRGRGMGGGLDSELKSSV